MKFISSDLKVRDIGVNSIKFDFCPPEKIEVISDIFRSTDLEIDYDIRKDPDFNKFLLLLKILGNSEKENYVGYKFSFASYGIYEIENECEDKIVEGYVLYSALPMLINWSRAAISNLTSYLPLGKFILPSIDLDALIKAKSLEYREETNLDKKVSSE